MADYGGIVLLIFLILIIIFIVAALINGNNNNHYTQQAFNLQRIYHLPSASYVVMRIAGNAIDPVTNISQAEPAYVNVLATGGAPDDPLGLFIIHLPTEKGVNVPQTSPPVFAIQNTVTQTFCSNADQNAGVLSIRGTGQSALIFDGLSIGKPEDPESYSWFAFEYTSLVPIIVNLPPASEFFYMRSAHPTTVGYVTTSVPGSVILATESSGRDLFALVAPITTT